MGMFTVLNVIIYDFNQTVLCVVLLFSTQIPHIFRSFCHQAESLRRDRISCTWRHRISGTWRLWHLLPRDQDKSTRAISPALLWSRCSDNPILIGRVKQETRSSDHATPGRANHTRADYTWQIWPQSGSDWPQIEQIRVFFRSVLIRICPIWGQSDQLSDISDISGADISCLGMSIC